MRLVVALALLGLGCQSKPAPTGTVDINPDSRVDVDVDADGGPSDVDGGPDDLDADGGPSDGDGDADDDDTGPKPEEFPCSAEPMETMVDECVTKELRCDLPPMMNTTKGAPALYDSEMYIAWQCFPFGDGPYGGPDRVFAFEHPGGGAAQINLHTPCGELDLFALQWTGWAEDDECPTEDHSHRVRCDDKTEEGDDTITLFEDGPMDYLIIVDGPDGERENFTLEAVCP